VAARRGNLGVARRVLVFGRMLPTAVVLGDLYLARCLAGNGVPLVIAGADPTHVAFRSRHARRTVTIAPWDQPGNVLADLEEIAASCAEPPVLFYDNDEQLAFVSRHRSRLLKSYRLLLPHADLVDMLVDKRRFGRFAQAHGLPVPRQIASHDVDGPDAALARLRLPCVIKPDVHRGWFTHRELFVDGPRKAFIVSTAGELRARWADIARCVPDFVVQEYIPGGEDQIYSFHAYADASGAVKAWFLGKKLRTFPRNAGISTFLELVHDPRLAELGFDIVRRTGLVGPMKMDFKRDPSTGSFHLLEINARFNLWHRLGAVSGVNLPMIAYCDLTATALPQATDGYTTDIRWLSFANDLRSFLRDYKPSGELGWLEWIGSLRGRLVYDVFAWSDPMPFVGEQIRYARALARRLAGKRATS
jgi:predicted ATP-grasp superfamily ATP-dependent carboligase